MDRTPRNNQHEWCAVVDDNGDQIGDWCWCELCGVALHSTDQVEKKVRGRSAFVIRNGAKTWKYWKELNKPVPIWKTEPLSEAWTYIAKVTGKPPP